MAELSNKVWGGINDFLLSLSSRSTVQELHAAILSGVHKLIPFDNSGAMIVFRQNAKPVICDSIGMGKKWRDSFNDFYTGISCPENDHFQKNPPRFGPGKFIYSVNYHELKKQGLRKDLYLNEFIVPQGIRYSAGLVISDHANVPACTFVLNRSGSGGIFSDQDLSILRIIQPHISNYYSTAGMLEQFRKMPVLISELEAHNRVLSGRESEIVYLLARRYRPVEIATELKISVLTVRKHIRHIYEKLDVTDRHQLFQKVNFDFKKN